MNIQDKMQEIHHKYGVSERANYEIQLFVEDLIKQDRAEQLNLSGVSHRREQLLKSQSDYLMLNTQLTIEQIVDFTEVYKNF
jgi:hypothetical protein